MRRVMTVREWEPHEYQRTAVEFLMSRNYGALFLEPGLGKTSIIYEVIRRLKAEGKISRVLVVAPLSVVYNVWPYEAKKWSNFNGLKVAVIHGPLKFRLLRSEYDVAVINYEGLPWFYNQLRTASAVRALGFDCLIADELSKFKNPQTMRFKVIRKLLDVFKYRYGLTGSPAANSLMDLFGECYILDGGVALGKFITHYRTKYFTQAGFNGYEWRLREGAEKEIYAAVKDLALRMSAEDYLTLPLVRYNDIMIDLPVKARKIYNELEAEMISVVDGCDVTALTAAAVSTKCRQICAGAVYYNDELLDKQCLRVHDEKVEALKALVEELNGRPLLVGYNFRFEAEAFAAAFPKAPIIGGGTPAKEAELIIQNWNAGRVPVLFGQPQSMGHGLNLQAAGCGDICWITPTWNYELYDQFNRRIIRQGTTAERVTIHHILARDSVDSVVMRALKRKHKTQTALCDALKEYAKEKKYGA